VGLYDKGRIFECIVNSIYFEGFILFRLSCTDNETRVLQRRQLQRGEQRSW